MKCKTCGDASGIPHNTRGSTRGSIYGSTYGSTRGSTCGRIAAAMLKDRTVSADSAKTVKGAACADRGACTGMKK